ELFLRELAARGRPAPERTEPGVFTMKNAEWTYNVSLDNISKDLDGEDDEGRMRRFVDTILATAEFSLPPWEEARPRVRFTPEPADSQFGDTFREPVTDRVFRVLVYASPDEMQIVWLTPDLLETWGVGREEVERAAAENMAELMRATPIETDEQHG